MFKLIKGLLVTSLAIAVLVIFFDGEQRLPLEGSFLDLSGDKADTPVVLHADKKGHFFGSLRINDVPLKYIVDSGASNVTLNSEDAIKAKIDYKKGRVVSLVTPAGEVLAFSLRLNGLMIGTTKLDDVETTVVEGESPPYVLLGISAQRKLDLKRDNAVMTLGKKR